MKIERFEDIIAWQRAKTLTINIYKTMQTCKDYGFRDQIQRASVSVMNNIAEGFERRTNKELKQFFFIAKGSCGEVRSMLHLGLELGYFAKTQQQQYLAQAEETSRLLSGFIKSLSTNG